MAEYEATMAMAAFAAPELVGTASPPPMDILDVVEPSAQMKAEVSRMVGGDGGALFCVWKTESAEFR